MSFQQVVVTIDTAGWAKEPSLQATADMVANELSESFIGEYIAHVIPLDITYKGMDYLS
jgi:hypothetical protein